MALLVKNLLFTLVVPASVAVFLPLWLVSACDPLVGADLWIGVGLMVLGALIYFWCLWDFAVHGRGTPAPIDAPGRLVVRGLYRHTRNPMYLGVLTVILGWLLAYQTAGLLIYFLCVAVGFHLAVVLYEEPTLSRKFGEEYAAYRQAVGRWLPRRSRAI